MAQEVITGDCLSSGVVSEKIPEPLEHTRWLGTDNFLVLLPKQQAHISS